MTLRTRLRPKATHVRLPRVCPHCGALVRLHCAETVHWHGKREHHSWVDCPCGYTCECTEVQP